MMTLVMRVPYGRQSIAYSLNRIPLRKAKFRPFVNQAGSCVQPVSNTPSNSHPIFPSQSTSGSNPTITTLPDRLWKAPLRTSDPPLRYQIHRTVPFGTLPVYTKMRPALSQVWTLVKKIDGDILQLKNHLLLDFPHCRPIVKPHIQQILMRGKFAKELKLWLQDRGF